MTNATSTLTSTSSHEIQVAGLRCFAESEWRNAILHYLFGVWDGNPQNGVAHRPKISFGCVVLRLNPVADAYVGYLNSDVEKAGDEFPRHGFPGNATLVVGYRRAQVENGLIRFVKNILIRHLALSLPGGCTIHLWKKGARGQYGYSASGLLLMDEVDRYLKADHF